MLGATRTTPSATMDPATDDDPSMGEAKAAVTIVEFSDYQCPYCQRWHAEVLPQIMAEYPGSVRFIYRDFPLSGHAEAQPAAEAANCAGDQDSYWSFSDAIFSGEQGYGRSAYEQYAADLGLDEDEFASCLDSRRHQAEVLEDYSDGIRLGVQSTPTFFVNGIQVVGAQPFETFQNLIESELAKAGL
jgi:protein-disulfide isomerase